VPVVQRIVESISGASLLPNHDMNFLRKSGLLIQRERSHLRAQHGERVINRIDALLCPRRRQVRQLGPELVKPIHLWILFLYDASTLPKMAALPS